MNDPDSIRDRQGFLLSRLGAVTAIRSIDSQKHHLCRWLVAALCFASSCAQAQQSVTLAWDRNSETNIAGYRLYYGTVTRVYTNMVNAGNLTTASVANLAPGVTYRFAVTAYSTSGLESDYSSEIAFTTTNIVTPNVPPTLAALGSLTINEDAGTQTVLLTGISSGGEIQTLTVTASASPSSLIPSVQTVYTSPRTTGAVSFATAPNASGTGVVNLTVSDGLAQTTRSFSVTVNPANDAPTLTAIGNATTVEDTQTAQLPFTVGDVETAAASLTLSGTSSDLALVPNASIVFGGSGNSRTVRVTPAANQFGTATINVSVSDGSLSASRTFQLTVTSSNDAPTLTAIGNATTVEDTQSAQLPFTVGDVETVAANLTLSGTSSDLALVPNASIVFGGSGNSRTVRVTPAANQFGTATINVSVSDGSLSASRTFQLTVTSSNDAPTIAALLPATVPVNIPTVLQPVVIADIDTAASSLVVTGTSSDTNVLPNANIVIGTLGLTRTLSVQPAQVGAATVTLRVSDGIAQSTQSFPLTVTNIVTPNVPPTLAGLSSLTINEDAGAQTVLLTGISSGGENQTLTVSASASPSSLIPSVQTIYTSPRTTGTVSFATAPNASGTGVVNVTVSDGLAQTMRSFAVTVNSANDAPTLTAIGNATTVEDTATAQLSFTVGDVETAAASLTLSGTSSNLALVPNANIVFGGSGADRTVRVTPAANQFGMATINVSVSDGSLSASRTFQLTVTSSNDPPTLTAIGNATTVEDAATAQLPFTVGDVETAAASLTVSGTSSDLALVPNANIVFSGSGNSRSVRVTPAANQFGTATINVSVSDGNVSASRTFQLTVTSSNDPPTIAALLPATAVPNTLTALQPVTIADIDTAASSLLVTATSSDTNVLPNANIVVGTGGSSRALSVRPLQAGTATVTLRVSDGVAQSTQAFLLTATNSTGQFVLRPSFNVASSGYTISWDSRVGFIYRVMTKTSLTQTAWIPLINIRATNTTTSWTDLTAGRQGLNVYRIEMTAPIGFEN